MEIFPNSNVMLCRGVPIDASYTHTIYFSSSSAQYSYFSGLAVQSWTKVSYQRANKGKIRLEVNISRVYNCNYMMFQNTDFENKWFYAFVTKVEYISNTVVEVDYVIDVMQTWFMTTCRLGQCFVEREHVTDDNVFWHTIPEDLEIGPYVITWSQMMTRPQSGVRYRILVAATFDENFQDVGGRIIDRVYSGCTYHVFTSAEEANQFITEATEQGKSDGIVSMFMVPDNFPSDYQVTTIPQAETITVPKNTQSLDGYVPRNAKLFSYPYNKLQILSDCDAQDYRWELFQDQGDTQWDITYIMNPSPSMILVPVNYAHRGTGVPEGYRMCISDFPQCTYNTDVFKVYLAQNAASLPVKMIGQAASGAIGAVGAMGGAGALAAAAPAGAGLAAALGPAGVAAGALVVGAGVLSGVAGTMAQMWEMERKPPQINGTQSSTGDYAHRNKNFFANAVTINRFYAAVIDDFFDMFGYKINRVKIPNLNTRPYWNYVKCQYVSVTGNCPADALVEIEKIFMNGITFWKNGANVGNYTLNNH